MCHGIRVQASSTYTKDPYQVHTVEGKIVFNRLIEINIKTHQDAQVCMPGMGIIKDLNHGKHLASLQGELSGALFFSAHQAKKWPLALGVKDVVLRP